CLLQACTHSILLLREDNPNATQLWQTLVKSHDICPFAQLWSQPTGPSTITTDEPILEGVITGLERSMARTSAGAGVLFDELLERIITLFTACDLTAWKNHYLAQAPTEQVIDVQQELRTFTTTSTSWEPTMLIPLLARWPAQTPLSVYGSGPGWLYATLAAYIEPQPFYLFDSRLSWIAPVPVALGLEIPPDDDMCSYTTYAQDFTILNVSFPNVLLSYLQSSTLIFPYLPVERGLIIDGKVPNWLLTALTRLYKAAGVAWIASFYPPRGAAVVVYSRNASPQIGDLVPLPGL
ncbi:MAG: CRISPR-associated protein Csx3, partial [Ktedonobacteraceae bacterium]